MLQPIVAQFTSRGMPADETEQSLLELAAALALIPAFRSGDADVGEPELVALDTVGRARTISFGDLAPEDTLPLYLPDVLAAGREAVAAGTPVALISECTLVPPLLAAVRERHPGVALVWIDAHGDLNTPDTTPSGFLGGMPFAQLLGWCFDDWRRQAGLEPPLPEGRAVLVGGRDLDPGERANVYRSQLHESDDAAGALAALPADAPLYVHVDTDVLDPSLTPDAGFPAPGGWSVERLQEELTLLAESGRVVAVSICPSAPPAVDAEAVAPLVDALR
jgi:arginase